MAEIKEKAQPYLYESSDKLAILVHGFTGTPDDMRELAKFLAVKGYSAKAVRLAGHGSADWQDLENTSYYDWWKAVDDEVKNASARYKKIFIIGYSFGANLAFDMAARYPDIVKGVVSLGISVYLKREYLIKTLLPFFHFFLKRYKKTYIKKKYLKEYAEAGGYVYMPTKSVYDFYNFVNSYTKKELHKVTAPSLIIHSRADAITHPKSSEFVYQRISSPRKELIILDDINHNPAMSQRKSLIFAKVEEFLGSL
ncbi:alpha/beta fold hydrolase [Patescibacteria group bacterium]|nr:alpha/beta fold hydrolase [Patescibacteria group bacterium]